MTHTVEETTRILELSDDDGARGLIKFLMSQDPPLARCRGERPAPRGSGHGPKVYEIDADAPTIVKELLERLTI